MFEITIKEIKTETKIVRPYTDAELSESEFYRQSDNGKKGETKPIYGYAPDREEDVKREVEILKQSVESVDLAAVIKAINNL